MLVSYSISNFSFAFECFNRRYFIFAHNKIMMNILTIIRIMNYRADRQVTTKLSAMRHHRSILKRKKVIEDNVGKFEVQNEQ